MKIGRLVNVVDNITTLWCKNKNKTVGYLLKELYYTCVHNKHVHFFNL